MYHDLSKGVHRLKSIILSSFPIIKNNCNNEVYQRKYGFEFYTKAIGILQILLMSSLYNYSDLYNHLFYLHFKNNFMQTQL